MGIQVGDNFDHKSKKPLDGRTQYATLSAMKAVTDANIPEGLEAYCVETDKYYQFKSTNTVDSLTGKWRERQSGSGASALSDLTDVTLTTPLGGQTLKFNGTEWVNGDLPVHSAVINDEHKVFTDYVMWGEERFYSYSCIDAHYTAGHDYLSLPLIPVQSTSFHLRNYYCYLITSCSGSTPDNYYNVSLKALVLYEGKYRLFVRMGKQVSSGGTITWKTNDWEEVILPNSVSTLTDTAISNPTSGQVLKYDGSKWVNGAESGGAKIDDATTSASKVWSSSKTNTEIGKAYRDTDTAETALADADYVPFYDTSATAKKKTLWSNIKSVLKTHFDTLYNPLMSNATELAKISEQGGNPTYDGSIISLPTVHNFDKSNLYSTTEKVVGCWTNNKPLYQKTISCGNLPNNTTKAVAHGISNIDAIIYNDFVFVSSNAYAMSNGSFASIAGNSSDLVGVWADNTYINIRTLTDRSSFSGYCTLRYTKTTDAANSFNYASENDYSTNETIIGTWINGETLFQRTYTGTTSASLGNTTIGNYTSTYKVKKIEAFISTSTAVVPVAYCTVSSTATDGAIRTWVDGGSVGFTIKDNNFLSKSVWVTIQYTKS